MTVPVLFLLSPDKILLAFGMLAFPPVMKFEEDPFMETSMEALLAELILIPRFELLALIIGPLPILLL